MFLKEWGIFILIYALGALMFAWETPALFDFLESERPGDAWIAMFALLLWPIAIWVFSRLARQTRAKSTPSPTASVEDEDVLPPSRWVA